MVNKTTHLTYTGYHAGATLCGLSRNNIDGYAHAIYVDRLNLEKVNVCKKCQMIWDICSICESDNCDVCKKTHT